MKNVSRTFATMSDDERRKFALEHTDDPTREEGEDPAADSELPTELEFDDPRKADGNRPAGGQ